MIVTRENRTKYLRTKNRFYVAGWVASELGEQAQEFKTANPKYREYFTDYITGYGDEIANSAALANISSGC